MPEACLTHLLKTPDLILTSLKENGIPVDKGYLEFESASEEMRVSVFFFHWVAEINEIIENINLVIHDLRRLQTDYVLFKGSPVKRYYLLIRTFFYEFYRFREIFNRFIKVAAERNYLPAKEVKPLRQIFHESFQEAIEMRNILVHDSPLWKGEEHLELMLFASAWEKDLELTFKETGEDRDIGWVLSKVCPQTSDRLQEVATRASAVNNLVIEKLSQIQLASLSNDANEI